MSKPQVDISPGNPRDSDMIALLTASHELMQAMFPEESNHYLSVDELCQPGIRFFRADLNGQAAGCAALFLKDGYGEVKSMFVDPARRGAKIGARLLDRIEAEARAENLPCLRLETGDKLTASHKLYAAHGFELRGPFGDYQDDPLSLFMEKTI